MSFVQTTWRVEGMHCVHCETAIVRAVANLSGVRRPKASYREGTLTAQWDESLTPLGEIEARLKAQGYALSARRGVSPWRAGLQLLAVTAGLFGLYLLMSRSDALGWFNAFPVARAGMSFGMLFLVGLLTSLHCVAMCGGINIAQSANAAQKGHGPGRANLMYNLGRVISYTAVGGIVGALGMAFSISAQVKAGIQIAAAAFMLIMALNLLGGFAWLRRLSISMPRGLATRIAARAAGRSSFFIGLANGLMPCGPLQSMQLFALSTGSWWMGALSMLCFSLGTVPLMLGIGLVGGRLNQRFARPMRVVSALLVVLMGMSMLTNGLALAGVGVSEVAMTADGFARLTGDRQVVRTELDYGGYDPITVQAGVPVEWTLVADGQKLNGCNNEIVIPAYGLTIPLKAGENVIKFTPETSGVVPFSCWMGMIRSNIYVVDSLEDASPEALASQDAPDGALGALSLPSCCGGAAEGQGIGCCGSLAFGADEETE
ncbi:MAG: sulfite exporter TauE/SafE family protein [Clostridia bacterium]|nr:sulfite exporter TauE/SafE family protein [Clostridia bacterium]MDO4356203.1 sulfite exporter TauE/SafE family protein [Clostridia bacterium]